MSDLQTDIQTVADGFGCGHTTHEQYEALENVEQAARRYAIIESIWWCEVHEMKGIEDMCGWTRVKNVTPGSCRMVRAAFGITKDTE